MNRACSPKGREFPDRSFISSPIALNQSLIKVSKIDEATSRAKLEYRKKIARINKLKLQISQLQNIGKAQNLESTVL